MIENEQPSLRPMMKISELVPYLKENNIKFEKCVLLIVLSTQGKNVKSFL